MTQREFYQFVIRILDTLDTEYVYDSEDFDPSETPEGYPTHVDKTINTDELAKIAQSYIDKLDEKNAKKRESTSPKQKANEDIKTKILETLAAEPERVFFAKELADTFETNTQHISALLKQLVDTGKVIKHEKVKDTKKNYVRGYQFAATDEEVE